MIIGDPLLALGAQGVLSRPLVVVFAEDTVAGEGKINGGGQELFDHAGILTRRKKGVKKMCSVLDARPGHDKTDIG